MLDFPMFVNFQFLTSMLYQKLHSISSLHFMSSSEIFSFLCQTVRGGYVSYDTASRAASRMTKEFGIDSDFAYDMFCKYLRGSYCSYERAGVAAGLMARDIDDRKKSQLVNNKNQQVNVQSQNNKTENSQKPESNVVPTKSYADASTQTTVSGKQFDIITEKKKSICSNPLWNNKY